MINHDAIRLLDWYFQLPTQFATDKNCVLQQCDGFHFSQTKHLKVDVILLFM